MESVVNCKDKIMGRLYRSDVEALKEYGCYGDSLADVIHRLVVAAGIVGPGPKLKERKESYNGFINRLIDGVKG